MSGDDHATVQCLICIEEVDVEHATHCVTACRHTFHEKCFRTWMGRSNACPTCRHKLYDDDVPAQAVTTPAAPPSQLHKCLRTGALTMVVLTWVYMLITLIYVSADSGPPAAMMPSGDD